MLFGRTLARAPQVLVLCEPTAGVDIGARHAIYDLVAEQVRRGLSVIVASSDVGDLLALCTRALVLHDGAVAQELEGRGLTEHRLVQAMEGVERRPSDDNDQSLGRRPHSPGYDEQVPLKTRLSNALSPSKIGGVYVLLGLIVLFSIWVPDTFPEGDTARQILNSNAISAMAAFTLVIPLSAGVFDISVPYTMTLTGVMCTYAIVNSTCRCGGFVIAMTARWRSVC